MIRVVENSANSVSNLDIEVMVRKYRRGMVNSLLEYLILNCLEAGRMCGYDIIKLLHERFQTLLSPGQVYPVIDYLARQGLILKEKEGRSIMLANSHLGRSLLGAWREELRSIQMEVNNLGINGTPLGVHPSERVPLHALPAR